MTTTANGSGRRISVHDATIKTATVEIRTLTVSGKQVTLAVFRQLLEEPILDSDMVDVTPKGEPWGRVNYCPGKAHCELAGGKAHTHIVWQKGDELRRCAVARYRQADDWFDTRMAVGVAFERYVCALALRDGKRPGELAEALGGRPEYHKDAEGETSYWWHPRVDDRRAVGELFQSLPWEPDAIRRVLAPRGAEGEQTDPAVYLEDLREAAADQARFLADFEAWLARVASLPQLFIAV